MPAEYNIYRDFFERVTAAVAQLAPELAQIMRTNVATKRLVKDRVSKEVTATQSRFLLRLLMLTYLSRHGQELPEDRHVHAQMSC
jgi:hypothetical protein